MSDSIIEGASVAVRTMADGTLRLTVDIEPRNAQAAFALFGAPGRALALAALKDGAGAVQEAGPPLETRMNAGKLKGGEWAKLAGMWCADKDFWAFLNDASPHGERIESAEQAAIAVRVYCGIGSRAELDHNKAALSIFDATVRHPFMKWMNARGIQK